jgi:hypothetical protein
MEAARKHRDKLADDAIAALRDGGFGARGSVLAEAARFTVERRN